MAVIRDNKAADNTLKVNADGSINVVGATGGGSNTTINTGGNPVSASNPFAVQVSQANAVLASTNPLPVQVSQGNATLTAANPFPTQLSEGNAVVSVTNPLPVMTGPATAITSVGTANTALTVTIPAPPAGQFHYIQSIDIARSNGATAATAGTAALSITTTNLPGTLQFRYPNVALPAGSVDNHVAKFFPTPIKSTTAATATTIVLPVPGTTATTTQWVVTVTYFNAT